jgi:DNA-binding FadR family transcriptional regulator
MSQNCTISHEIANSLRSDILSQRYRGGDRLPSERELAASFEASRGAVREALSQLEQLRLIKIQPGGARVQPIDKASIAILGPLLELEELPDPALVDQFLQVFGAMAALNAREAVTAASAADRKDFRRRVLALKQHGTDFASAQGAWVDLMESMSALTENLVLRLIGNDLQSQFVGGMLKLGIKPTLRRKVVMEILTELETALKEADRDLAHSAIMRYFDELRLAMYTALTSKLAG